MRRHSEDYASESEDGSGDESEDELGSEPGSPALSVTSMIEVGERVAPTHTGVVTGSTPSPLPPLLLYYY